MTTKDQERKALEKIREIIAGLGNDSYIGAAIDETVLNLAEDNINNDFLITMTSRLESAGNDIAEAKREARETAGKLKEMTDERDRWKKSAEQVRKEADANKAVREKMTEEFITENNKRREAEKRAEDAEAEIIILKSRLYDYMTK